MKYKATTQTISKSLVFKVNAECLNREGHNERISEMFEKIDMKRCGINSSTLLVVKSDDDRAREKFRLRLFLSIVDSVKKFDVSVTDKIESVAKLLDSTSFIFDVAEGHEFAQGKRDGLKFSEVRIIFQLSVWQKGGKFENKDVENALDSHVKFETFKMRDFDFDIIGNCESVAGKFVDFKRFG